MAWSTKYSIEFWDKHGNLLADYSGKAFGRQIVKSRNQPDDISFRLDLDDFEKYCRQARVDPKQILIVNSTEVRVRRLGTYISGGQLIYKNVSITAQSKTIDCRAKGFLWLFSKRFTGETPGGLVQGIYSTADGTADLSRTDLFWELISQSQALPSGDFGITRGLSGGSTTTYQKKYGGRTRIMDALVNLTELDTDPIDIEFTHDKVANTYAHIGSERPDIIFEYPGNIIGLEVSDDGTDITNQVIGLGSGAQDGTGVVYFAEDASSQANYQLRQDILQTNGTDNSDNGITDASEARLKSKSDPIRVPIITLNGNIPPFVTDYGIGDRINVKVNDHETIDFINGGYRVEKLTIILGDSGDDETIKPEVSAV